MTPAPYLADREPDYQALAEQAFKWRAAAHRARQAATEGWQAARQREEAIEAIRRARAAEHWDSWKAASPWAEQEVSPATLGFLGYLAALGSFEEYLTPLGLAPARCY